MRWLVFAALAACSTSHADPTPKDASATPDPATVSNHKVTKTGQVMGTNVQITFWTANDEAADAAFTAAMDELARIDKLMTTWTPDSEVSQINTAAGEKTAVKVSDETFTVIARA